jgi:pimeloyl-ACP methyl ester carboxylesterase
VEIENAAPPVVLVHGFGSSFSNGWERHGWTDLLIEAGRPVIGVDMLGHGLSERPHDALAYGDVDDRVAGAFAEHPIVDAIGFSAGAGVLLRLAARTPERFRRLVLLGVGDSLFRPPTGDVLSALEGPASTDDPHTVIFRRLLNSPDNDRQALLAFLGRPSSPVSEALLASVSCPVLVVIGDRDPAGPADRLTEALPRAQCMIVAGMDHFATPSDYRVIDKALEFVTG